MARIKLELPQIFCFSTSLTIRIGDINYGNHLGNDALLGLIHEARYRFIRHCGFTSELDMDGSGLILADTVIVYKAEGFWGDTLQVDIALDDFTTFGGDLYYRLAKPAGGQELAHAKTGIVFFDYTKRKLTKMPSRFKAFIDRNLGHNLG